MKAHPTLGYELVKNPRGIEGDNTLGESKANMIHDFGAVTAVADIYDATASDRPYRPGWPPDKVVGLIRDLSETQLNSKVVDIFLKTVAPYPIATSVRVLNGTYEGHETVVADIDEKFLDRPKVRILFDSEGVRIDAVEIDLKVEEDIMVESVRSGVPEMEPLGSSKAVVEVESDD